MEDGTQWKKKTPAEIASAIAKAAQTSSLHPQASPAQSQPPSQPTASTTVTDSARRAVVEEQRRRLLELEEERLLALIAAERQRLFGSITPTSTNAPVPSPAPATITTAPPPPPPADYDHSKDEDAPPPPVPPRRTPLATAGSRPTTTAVGNTALGPRSHSDASSRERSAVSLSSLSLSKTPVPTSSAPLLPAPPTMMSKPLAPTRPAPPVTKHEAPASHTSLGRHHVPHSPRDSTSTSSSTSSLPPPRPELPSAQSIAAAFGSSVPSRPELPFSRTVSRASDDSRSSTPSTKPERPPPANMHAHATDDDKHPTRPTLRRQVGPRRPPPVRLSAWISPEDSSRVDAARSAIGPSKLRRIAAFRRAPVPPAPSLNLAPISRLPRYKAPGASQVMVTPDHVLSALEEEKRLAEEEKMFKKMDRENNTQLESRAFETSLVRHAYSSISFARMFDAVVIMSMEMVGEKREVKSVFRHPTTVTEEMTTLEKSIGPFCFPDADDETISYKNEDYAFVLTDVDGKKRFGYCRRINHEVICVVSSVGAFSIFADIVGNVTTWRVSKSSVLGFLDAAWVVPLPAPGSSISITGGKAGPVVLRRRGNCAWHEHVEFETIFSALSPMILMQVFGSILVERRIILTSASISKLSSCVHALLALLYPFEWPHVFIPILPRVLCDFCCSPMPYIIGVLTATLPELEDMELEAEGILIVDLDEKNFLKCYGDEKRILPDSITAPMKRMLDATPKTDGVAVADVFLKFFLEIMFPFPKSMMIVGEEVVFDKERFLRASPRTLRDFLKTFLDSQLFDVFIEERERACLSGTLMQGAFEQGYFNLT